MKKLVLCSLAALMVPSFALAKTDAYSCQLSTRNGTGNDWLNLASKALTCNVMSESTCGKNYYAMVKGAHRTGKGTTYAGLDVYKCVVTPFDDFWAANLEKEIVECGDAQKCSWSEFGGKGGYVYRTNKSIQRDGSSYYVTGTIENFCRHKKEAEMKQTCSAEYVQKCDYNNKKREAGSTIDNCGGGLVSKKQHCVSLLHSCNGATGSWDVLPTTLRCEDGWVSNGAKNWDDLECIKSIYKGCEYNGKTYKEGARIDTCDGGLAGKKAHCKHLQHECQDGRFMPLAGTLICDTGWESNGEWDWRDLECVKE